MNGGLKILLPGGAGLVGQNLVIALKERGYHNIVVIDKHVKNLHILRLLHPDIEVIEADLSKPGQWQTYFEGAHAVVMLQAQIGGLFYEEFVHNNVQSTKLILDLIQSNSMPYLVHISSSVVKSVADDFYTRSKCEQEEVVVSSGIPCVILRPTLMFGWFDRKHLGWLSRLMKKIPIFPIPGNGRYMRQPLYVGDFCQIIISCIDKKIIGQTYNITGLEKIDYIDMIREIKNSLLLKTAIIKIPYSLFYCLLWIWSLFDKKPPFTTQQLEALVAKDEFEVIDWSGIFGVTPTSFGSAISHTHHHPRYSQIVLDF